MVDSNKTSLVDSPRLASEPDSFGIDTYSRALCQYIAGSDSPITIAIQGEWGSGKTSLMNVVEDKLCGTGGKFYPIWVNTWQFSLLENPHTVLINIISNITQQVISTIHQNYGKSFDDISDKLYKSLKIVGRSALKSAVNLGGLDGNVVDELSADPSGQLGIMAIRDQLAEAIKRCLAEAEKKGEAKKGFIFFIDDLDRIDPPVAVQILELVKNIFEIKNCIFVLAIDYDVVVKGLESKFGKLTENNEREFRSFFDKIIQLPFSMPVESYEVSDFIRDSFLKIEFITEEELTDTSHLEVISDLTKLSIGTNPRALKRMTNTLSLLQIINRGSGVILAPHQKRISYALLCLQISYPQVYAKLQECPDFDEWGQEKVALWNLEAISSEELAVIQNTEQFDEEWEQILFRVCAKDIYLKSSCHQISTILGMILEEIPADQTLEKVILTLLDLANVTSVNTSETNKKTKSKDRRGEFYYDFSDQLELKLQEQISDIGVDRINVSARKNISAGIAIYLYFGKDKAAINLTFLKKDQTSYLLQLRAFNFLKTAFEKIELESFRVVNEELISSISNHLKEFKNGKLVENSSGVEQKKSKKIHDRYKKAVDTSYVHIKFLVEAEDYCAEDFVTEYSELITEITKNLINQLAKIRAIRKSNKLKPIKDPVSW